MRLSEKFGYADLRDRYRALVPLFLIEESGDLEVVAAASRVAPGAGQTLIALVEDANAEAAG